MTSDSAANCVKGRKLLTERMTRILNMGDACHNLHNACKDICNMHEFKDVFIFILSHGLLAININIGRPLQIYVDCWPL